MNLIHEVTRRFRIIKMGLGRIYSIQVSKDFEDQLEKGVTLFGVPITVNNTLPKETIKLN